MRPRLPTFSLTLALGLIATLSTASAQSSRVFKVPDQFPTIQAALDADDDGFEIEIDAGTYEENLVLTDKLSVTIRGKGTVTIDGGGKGHTIRIVDGDGIVFEKLTITGGNPHGVEIETSTPGVDVRFIRCTFEDNAVDGIHSDHVNGLLIDRCTIRRGAGTGIHVDGADFLDVTKCRIEEMGQDGVGVGTSGSTLGFSIPAVRILKNRIEGVGGVGVRIRGASILIAKNRFADTGDDAVSVESLESGGGGSGILIEKNVVRDAGGFGIVIGGASGEASKNEIKGAGGVGIFLIGEGGHTVVGNKISKVDDDGIEAWSGAGPGNGNFIEGNKVKKAGGDGIDIETTGNIVSGNRVKKSGDNGFEVIGGGNTFTENRASKSGAFDLSDTSDGSNTYADDRFPDVDPAGHAP